MRRILLGATIALLLSAAPAWPLDPTLAITQYRHDVWNTKHGLPQSSVESGWPSGMPLPWPGGW